MHGREDMLVCPCRGSRVLSATVEVITILVNSKALARACVVLELAKVRDWQSRLLRGFQDSAVLGKVQHWTTLQCLH